MTTSGIERLRDKLAKDTSMPESAVERFIELKNEIDVLWDKPGFSTGSNRKARNRRYDEQMALLKEYRND
jgi:hypothetical protein